MREFTIAVSVSSCRAYTTGIFPIATARGYPSEGVHPLSPLCHI